MRQEDRPREWQMRPSRGLLREQEVPGQVELQVTWAEAEEGEKRVKE